MKYIRYALATFCCAASVGCLGLWWRSQTVRDILHGPVYVFPGRTMTLYSGAGVGGIQLLAPNPIASGQSEWFHQSVQTARLASDMFADGVKANGPFEILVNELAHGVRFPHWYSALIFAIAGIASLRIGHRFTIRSAMIATTVVAMLLGMAVIL